MGQIITYMHAYVTYKYKSRLVLVTVTMLQYSQQERDINDLQQELRSTKGDSCTFPIS